MNRKWNPVNYIGYSEKSGLTENKTDALAQVVDEMRQTMALRQEQERLLGSDSPVSEEEKEEIKRRMLERLGG